MERTEIEDYNNNNAFGGFVAMIKHERLDLVRISLTTSPDLEGDIPDEFLILARELGDVKLGDYLRIRVKITQRGTR